MTMDPGGTMDEFGRRLRRRNPGGGLGGGRRGPLRRKDVDTEDIHRTLDAFREITRGW